MVDVRCLILCSKFANNRLSLGELTALPGPSGWIMGKGEERGDGRTGGGGKGRRGRGGYPPPNENPGYVPVYAMAAHASIHRRLIRVMDKIRHLYRRNALLNLINNEHTSVGRLSRLILLDSWTDERLSIMQCIIMVMDDRRFSKSAALNCLVFEKIAFFCILATKRQTDEQTLSFFCV